MNSTKTLAKTVSESFLSRVPEIMTNNPDLSIEEAIQEAYDVDERFCYRFMFKYGNPTDQDRAVVRELSDRVYRKLNA